MTTGKQVLALLQCYSDGDSERFITVALQVAAHEARAGNGSLAGEVRDIVDSIKRQSKNNRVAANLRAEPRSELQNILGLTYPKTRLSEVVLDTRIREILDHVLFQHRSIHKLRFAAPRPLLFVGAPGCGKTMTAAALAGELHLPLFTVNFRTLLSNFMGETDGKMHAIFEFIQTTTGVYFFDEFEEIATSRYGQQNRYEALRTLNSFLQFLEQHESSSLIIAATNYHEIINKNIFRRFEEMLCYDPPNSEQAELLIKNRIHRFLTNRPSWTKILLEARGLSYAEIARACDDVYKKHILQGTISVGSDELVSALKDRRRARAS